MPTKLTDSAERGRSGVAQSRWPDVVMDFTSLSFQGQVDSRQSLDSQVDLWSLKLSLDDL